MHKAWVPNGKLLLHTPVMTEFLDISISNYSVINNRKVKFHSALRGRLLLKIEASSWRLNPPFRAISDNRISEHVSCKSHTSASRANTAWNWI